MEFEYKNPSLWQDLAEKDRDALFAYGERYKAFLDAGKTERGETHVFIPGTQIRAVVERLLTRIEKTGNSSITHPGDYFPGRDVCKNCPKIVFKAD